MKEKQWILMYASTHETIKQEFFDTYDDAYKKMKKEYEMMSKMHEEMRKLYEIISKGVIGELNDYDAWCIANGYSNMWKICHIEIK